MSNMHQLGEAQLAIMNVLWTKKRATIREIIEALPPERRATTVASNLRNLEGRKLVARQRMPRMREYLYRPIVSSRDVIGGILEDTLGRLLAGAPAMLIKHLIQTEGFSSEELREIRVVVEEQESLILANRASSQKETPNLEK